MFFAPAGVGTTFNDTGALVASPGTPSVTTLTGALETAIQNALHIATAVGTPAVGIFGPTDPARNGPWSEDDVSVSRFDRCECHYDRTCHGARWCLEDVTVAEVCAAVQQRVTGRARG